MLSQAMRDQRRGEGMPPLSSPSSTSSVYPNDTALDRATPPAEAAPPSSSASSSSADLARHAETSQGVGGIWGPTRSPTIRPPLGVAPRMSDVHAVPPPSTPTPSATPPPTALVMESLARRYRAEEGRLLRWRLGGSKPVAPRSSNPTSAGAGHGVEGASYATGMSVLGRSRAALSLPAAAAAGRGSTGERLRAGVVEAVQRSQIARAVQAWWRGRAQLTRMAAKARHRRHATATVGVHLLGDSMTDHEMVSVGSAPAYGTAHAGELPVAPALSAWVSSAGRALLRRFSPSLEVSNVDQHCVGLELHRRAAHRRAGVHVRGDDAASHGVDDDSEGSWDAAADLEPQQQQQHRHRGYPESGQPTFDTAGDALEPSPAPTSSSSSSASSRASREGSRDGDALHAPRAAAPGGRTVDEGSFTLLWVRGLRGDGPARAEADNGDDSFRSASRLVARSRARFGRWLRRQQRLQAARRSLHRVSQWRRSLSGTVGAFPQSGAGLGGLSEAAPRVGALPPALRARTANAQPSPWEAPLPAHPEAAADGTDTGRSPVEGPPRQREQLLAAIAAGTAAWQAQLRRSEAEAEAAPALETRAAEGAPAVVPRAVQRARDDDAALARLSGSLAVLAQLERRASTATARGPGTEEAVHEASERATETTSARSLASPAPDGSESRRRASAPLGHARADADASDEDSAFRSLLRETTHTPRDAAVRSAYDAVMGAVCAALVRDDVDSAVGLRRSAADRALTQWVERQVLQELLHPSSGDQQHPQQRVQPLDCVGVLRHLRSGVPVSLSCLRLDEADRRALDGVRNFVRGDATAAAIGAAGFKISFAELASLRPGEWLNDQVINNYLELLRLEAGEASTAAPAAATHPRHGITAMSTHFYAKVEQELGVTDVRLSNDAQALPPLSAKSDVLRWLRRKQEALVPYKAADPQAVRAVLVPVNIEAQHWALAVLYRADRRWVLYDSLSRSATARRRGAAILARLAHAWREAQRHYGHLEDETVSAAAAGGGTPASAVAEVPPTPQPWVSACLVAAPCTRGASSGPASAVSPLDSLAPYGSLDALRRAEKRLRHHEDLLAEQAAVKVTRVEDDGGIAKTEAAGSHQTEQWTDTEVSWFTGGFGRAPQQANGYDCGMFVCQAAWCVAQGVAVDFTQADVSLLRSVITLELLSKKLLRRYPTAYTSGSAGV